MNQVIEHLLTKAREAQVLGRPDPTATVEAVAVALILDRPDWLAAMDYTLASAIGRIDRDWLIAIPEVAKLFHEERDEAAYEAAVRMKSAKFAAELVTSTHSPGYRDATLIFRLRPIGEEHRPSFLADICIRPEDGEAIVSHILDVHRWAWGDSSSGQPTDVKPDEKRPRWIDRI